MIPVQKPSEQVVTIKAADDQNKPPTPVVVKKPLGRPLGSVKVNREVKLEQKKTVLVNKALH